MSWLERRGRLSVTQPLSRPVSSNDEAYYLHTQSQGASKLGWRQFRRELYFRFSDQAASLCERIDPSWKRGLWLYQGVPQIGDALMDLAPRSLLAQRGLTVDLCTDPHIANMFDGDPWFGHIFSKLEDAAPAAYDFVIVQSHKRRSLKDKARLMRDKPWVSMHGYYTGPEFHRAEFATQRLLDLLGEQVSHDEFLAHARQKLAPLHAPPEHERKTLEIAFAVGGVDPLRSYRRWPELAVALEELFDIEITLIGSANGLEAAKAFEAEWPEEMHNLVAQTDLQQCREAIHAQDVLVACDGGLMHLGTTTDARVVGLFHSGVNAEWRLPFDAREGAIQSATNDVNDIEPALIVEKVAEMLQAVP